MTIPGNPFSLVKNNIVFQVVNVSTYDNKEIQEILNGMINTDGLFNGLIKIY